MSRYILCIGINVYLISICFLFFQQFLSWSSFCIYLYWNASDRPDPVIWRRPDISLAVCRLAFPAVVSVPLIEPFSLIVNTVHSYEIICSVLLLLVITTHVNCGQPSEILFTPTNHSHAKPLSTPILVNYFLWNVFMLNIKMLFMSLLDSFFRTWKDYTYGQVLSQIFNYYGEIRSQNRTNQISVKVHAYLSNSSMCRKSNIYVTKWHCYILHKYFSEKICH